MQRRIGTARRLLRARRIGATAGKVYLGLRTHRFIARRLAPADMPQRWRAFHRHSAESIYATAVDLQGLILKGCQFLGTRADVLPPEYVEVLSRLQDRVPARSFAVVRRTIESELGGPLEDFFAEFSPTARAAASLAQVHEARLHDGTRVAVKVQYPEIEELVHVDLGNLRTIFRAIGLLERDFDLMPLIDEIGSHVPRELDFTHEGRCAERVAGFFRERDDVAVPRIHWDLSRRRVLVMDLIEGMRVDDLPALRAAGLDPEQVGRILVEAYCEQIFLHGFFHADPHPGNLIVQRAADGTPRLVFIDFGLTKELPDHFRENALRFAAALLQGEPAGMADAMLQLGFETRDGRPEALADLAAFVLELAQRFRHGVKLDPEFSERFGREVPRRIRENPIVRVPTHLVLLGRVIGLLSGIHRLLDSDLDLARTLLPYASGLRPAPRA